MRRGETGRDEGELQASGRVTRIPAAAPASRFLRFLLGAALLSWIVPPVLAASPANQLRVWAVVAGLTLLYGLVHWLVGRSLTWLHPWLGAVIAVGPVTIVALAGSIPSAAAILYIGLSLVLIAIRGEPGCEVLAIPAAISRRPTHLACLLFSPLDWIERRLFGSSEGESIESREGRDRRSR